MKRAILILIGLVLCLAAAGASRADDTEIYGIISVSLQPNVLIIFDTSGSMRKIDVPGVPYEPLTTYAGSYLSIAVYRETSGDWELFANDVLELQCDTVKNQLLTDGYCYEKIKDSADTYVCGGSKKKLRLGNYMNYDEAGIGDAERQRVSVAQQVVTSLINDVDNVRFGVMRFDEEDAQGGYIPAGCECGADKTTLINTINNFEPSGYTPLAETLAEAGLYFAGMDSWFNSGVTYTSPMQARCQKNYIIVMTDGNSTEDDDDKLEDDDYINGDTIGDYDEDDNDPGDYEDDGSDYLDDVAKYLYENDCNPTLGTGTSFEKQNIITYTIGFKIQQQLLQDTAINGGGLYYVANNISALTEAFGGIVAEILEQNAAYVAPVVPVSRMNRTYAGNRLYLGVFRPQLWGRWLGNIKKYGLNSDGELIDADGRLATTSDGEIKDNARSYWSALPDGPAVNEGGAGGVLLDQANRNIYTYTGTKADLTHEMNEFSYNNPWVTNGMLSVGSNASRENLINDIHGGDRSWILADILHSEPAVVDYGSKTVIFAGSNDGMMHCFDDSNGSELWGFIPPDQLYRLPLLLNADHDYFVDGSPVLYGNGSQKILFFGERRGGDHYYALDVTSYSVPRWLYKIGPDKLGGGDAQLGQSWCKPEICKIKTGSETSDTVFLMAGGYDTNQDAETPAAFDARGRAVFTLKVTDGTLSSLNFHKGNYSDMTHCIVDVSGFDSNGDGVVNRVYAGDFGGHMFAFEDDDGDGTWSKRKLFSAPGTGKKIFYAPDAVEESFGEIIFFGTGNRAHPTETLVVNRLYAIKNLWEDIGTFTTLTESDLVDATEDLIQMGTEEQKAQVEQDLKDETGWYIRFENAGEKVVSSPRVFGGVVYFTTYTPELGGAEPEEEDLCGGEARGTARLYALDYLTGASVCDYSEVEETDAEGNVVELGKLDRSKVMGTAIPSAPVVAIHQSGPKMYIGVEGGVQTEAPQATTDLNIYYWRQIYR